MPVTQKKKSVTPKKSGVSTKKKTTPKKVAQKKKVVTKAKIAAGIAGIAGIGALTTGALAIARELKKRRQAYTPVPSVEMESMYPKKTVVEKLREIIAKFNKKN